MSQDSSKQSSRDASRTGISSARTPELERLKERLRQTDAQLKNAINDKIFSC